MDQLKRLRREQGLSQAKLAALADIDPSSMNQIERGAREPSLGTLRKLAGALDVSVAELLDESTPKVRSRSQFEPSFNDELEAERLLIERFDALIADLKARDFADAAAKVIAAREEVFGW
jgi:transcriptional regulator with XRE-family HTH domain